VVVDAAIHGKKEKQYPQQAAHINRKPFQEFSPSSFPADHTGGKPDQEKQGRRHRQINQEFRQGKRQQRGDKIDAPGPHRINGGGVALGKTGDILCQKQEQRP
jgi:hypothetical protein